MGTSREGEPITGPQMSGSDRRLLSGDEAVALAEYEELKLGNSEWDRPRKLASQERVLGCSIEAFAHRGNVEAMRAAITKLRTVQDQRNEDEKKNAKKRDPLFGIVRQD